MSLSQWLERIEACHPAEIELGLERLRKVVDRLELQLDSSFKIVAGGTNGKGSSLAMLDAILQQAGLTTGRYSSPHFLRYNERVLLNGEPATDDAFCRVFHVIEQARGDIPLTYFEYGTLAALLIMSEAKVDVMLLEVGLGGRLDAVNIVDADLAMVSTVALDHTDWLGPDREAIGFEKAGIYRAGRPALCGDPEPPAALLNTARQLGARLLCRGETFAFEIGDNGWCWRGEAKSGVVAYTDLPDPGLPLSNAAMILQALQYVPWDITEDMVRSGLRNVRLTGRMQRECWRDLDLLLDVAHNPEAAQYLAARLAEASTEVHLVLGMMHDKDIAEVVTALKPHVAQWYPVNLPIARAATAEQLRQVLEAQGVAVGSIHVAVDTAEALSDLAEREVTASVVVAGSFFTVAAALECIGKG